MQPGHPNKGTVHTVLVTSGADKSQSCGVSPSCLPLISHTLALTVQQGRSAALHQHPEPATAHQMVHQLRQEILPLKQQSETSIKSNCRFLGIAKRQTHSDRLMRPSLSLQSDSPQIAGFLA